MDIQETIDFIYEGISEVQDPPRFPREEIEAALKIQDEITPYLLKELEVISQDQEVLEDAFDRGATLAEFSILLLAKFRCKEAFPYLLDIFQFEDDLIDDYFESFLTEGLSNSLLSTYNGDYDSLVDFILNSEANEWARDAASWCLTGLALHGIEPRDKVINTYLSMSFSFDLIENQKILISNGHAYTP